MPYNQLFGFLLNITWFPALCFILGFILITVELFNPGFGIAGISALILFILGIIFSARTFLDAIIMIILILLIIAILLFIVLRSASKGRLNKKLILPDRLSKDSGYVGRNEPESFLGKEGITLTVLRPSGNALIDGVKLDVVTEGEYIPKNTRVKVTKVEGIRIVVKEVEQADNNQKINI